MDAVLGILGFNSWVMGSPLEALKQESDQVYVLGRSLIVIKSLGSNSGHLWVSCLISLCLRVLICKIGKMIAPSP